MVKQIAILRLRNGFALRNRHSAQDDMALEVTITKETNYSAAAHKHPSVRSDYPGKPICLSS